MDNVIINPVQYRLIPYFVSVRQPSQAMTVGQIKVRVACHIQSVSHGTGPKSRMRVCIHS